MGLNSGAVVAGPLSPVDSRDTSATHQAQYGIGTMSAAIVASLI